MAQVKQLVIFDGPDGAGKTTAAKALAELLGARYVHFSAMPRVGDGLARMYVEAMLPALLGYQPVVFDRSWLSEVPYGVAYRGGRDRLGAASRRMLERLALRCGGVVLLADPGWVAVVANYTSRKALEMLENEQQLRQVYDLFHDSKTSLPVVDFNYRRDTIERTARRIFQATTGCHNLEVRSAGSWNALHDGAVLVGEGFGERKDHDAFYQWPFASFSGTGCSQWLANQLEEAGIDERDLFWINADQDLSFLKHAKHLVALGGKAAEALTAVGLKDYATFDHPQHWKRFNSKHDYLLINYLKGL